MFFDVLLKRGLLLTQGVCCRSFLPVDFHYSFTCTTPVTHFTRDQPGPNSRSVEPHARTPRRKVTVGRDISKVQHEPHRRSEKALDEAFVLVVLKRSAHRSGNLQAIVRLLCPSPSHNLPKTCLTNTSMCIALRDALWARTYGRMQVAWIAASILLLYGRQCICISSVMPFPCAISASCAAASAWQELVW